MLPELESRYVSLPQMPCWLCLARSQAPGWCTSQHPVTSAPSVAPLLSVPSQTQIVQLLPRGAQIQNRKPQPSLSILHRTQALDSPLPGARLVLALKPVSASNTRHTQKDPSEGAHVYGPAWSAAASDVRRRRQPADAASQPPSAAHAGVAAPHDVDTLVLLRQA